MKQITTDVSTFKQYEAAGLWKPKGKVKWHKNNNGIVEASVSLKRRKGETENTFIDATIIINQYFNNRP